MTDGVSYFSYPTPLGKVTIAANGRAVVFLGLGDLELAGTRKATELTNRTASQIQEYLAGKRQEFSVPTAPQGTPFQRRVWDALAAIPYGQTRTAAQVAEMLGAPKSFRSVGAAVNRNPLPILVPSHRVSGSKGAAALAPLLELERSNAGAAGTAT